MTTTKKIWPIRRGDGHVNSALNRAAVLAREFDAQQLRRVYDLERLQATLENAPPDGEGLTVEVAAEWVRQVYKGGWTTKERKRFEQARNAFQTVLQSLRPLCRAPEGEEQFRDMFQGVELLPRCFYKEYETHRAEKRYLLATQLLVPIPPLVLSGCLTMRASLQG